MIPYEEVPREPVKLPERTNEGEYDDEAALLVLSAQTWVELPPAARPYFELELAENHDLIISSNPRDLAVASLQQPYLGLVQDQLSERMGQPVTLLELVATLRNPPRPTIDLS